MTKTLTLSAIALALSAGAAAAQANRTFVSGSGSDANPCSLAAPCRSFAQAIIQTNPGGEIAVLDTAGYGAVTIDRAVSIINQDGVEAGVTVTSGDGITVAANANDVVNLRGLTIVGVGAGTGNGITFASGRSLRIDKCEIRGFPAAGISTQSLAALKVTVTDTTVANNFQGIFVGGGGGTLTVSRLHATGNGNAGIVLSPTISGAGSGAASALVVDSLFDNNAFGIIATGVGSFSGNFSLVAIDKSAFSSTQADLSANGAGGIITAGRSQVGGASLGTSSGGGKLQSYGDNHGINNLGAPSTF